MKFQAEIWSLHFDAEREAADSHLSTQRLIKELLFSLP